jgi:F-type H+-transporting ATPase subunit a
MSNLHISVSAEPVFHIGQLAISNSILTSLFVAVILISLSLYSFSIVKATNKPKGFQNFLEMLIEGLLGLTNSITESKAKTKTIFPFVLSFFLFIVLNNWIGLLPGVGTIGFIEHEEVQKNEHTYQLLKSITITQAHAQDITTNSSLSLTPSNIAYSLLPSIISVIAIAISFWASKNVKVSQSTGLQNFLEAVVEKIRNTISTINNLPKIVKTIFRLFIVAVILYQLLLTTGIIPKNGVERAPRQPKSPKVVMVKPEKPAKTEAKPTTKFIPYFRAGTADLNTTIALALISVIATQVIGFKYLGLHYMNKYINFKSPIDAFVGLLEAVSEISKIISFAFRLFGNIFAGEVLLAVIYFLLPILVPIPFLGLEIFVGTIQALVFTTLSLVFMNLATQGHGEAHEEVYA